MQNRFDKIKLSIPLESVDRIEDGLAKNYSGDGDLKYETYKRNGLTVVINHRKSNVMIELSGKVLRGKYVEGITIDNIGTALQSIRKAIQVKETVLYSADVLSCEVISEFRVDCPSKYIEALFSLSKLQSKYSASPRTYKRAKESVSFYLKKNVNTNRIKDFLSIYDKSAELEKEDNEPFLASLDAEERDAVKSHFMNIVRFETKLHGKTLLRQGFGLGDTIDLISMLTSTVNVNHQMMTKLFQEEMNKLDDLPQMSYKQIDRCAALEKYDNDLEKIYAMHLLHGNRREKSKVLKPYKDVMRIMARANEFEQVILVKEILNKISW